MKRLAVLLGLTLLVTGSPARSLPALNIVDHSTKVTVSPGTPSSSDDITVTLSRWVQGGWGPVSSTVRRQGNTLRVNVHWEDIYVVIAVYPAPWCRHQYTTSLGRLAPGNYSVVVTSDHDGRVQDSGSAHVTVTDSGAAPDPNDESPAEPEPEPNGGSLIDQLRHGWNAPSSSSPSLIDRLRIQRGGL